MPDYISKYSGTQIDLAVASGSTTTGKIIVAGNISSSGQLYGNIVNVKTRVKAIGSSLEFAGNTLDFVDGASTRYLFRGVDGGAFSAYHSGNKKLETTSGGIDVTGNITTSGNISGSATSTGSFARVEATINPSVLVYDTQTIAAAGANQYNATAISASSGPLVFVTGADNTKAVLLPKLSTVDTGQSFEIHNTVSNKTLEVFPNISDKINPAADNAAITVAASTSLVVYKYNASGWVGHETSPIGA